MLGKVNIPRPEERAKQFPHEFSGGMRQRAMIAMALALNPDLLIADEPTTALDVTVQAQILDLIDRLKDEFNAAVIIITHDLGVVAEHCDNIQVMYAGKAVEFGNTDDIYYTAAPPVHVGAAAVDPATGRRGEGAAAPDPGSAAVADQRAAGLRVPSAVPVRHGRVHGSRCRRCCPSTGTTRPRATSAWPTRNASAPKRCWRTDERRSDRAHRTAAGVRPASRSSRSTASRSTSRSRAAS